MSSINLKPNKPEAYDGSRDYVKVNTWLYMIEQYLNLTQLSAPNIVINDHNRISFASSYLKENAAVWWYHLVNLQSTPTTWDSFKEALLAEFIPVDHTRRARDKLRKLKQTSSVERYLSEYRNITLMINDMSEGEKVDRFVDGLKYKVRVELLKLNCSSFEECARVALNVDSAIWGARRGQFGNGTLYDDGQPSRVTPMEIGNVNSSSQSRTLRNKKGADKGACYRCNKPGCRPWKCNPLKVNNVSQEPQTTGDSQVYLSDSENE